MRTNAHDGIYWFVTPKVSGELFVKYGEVVSQPTRTREKGLPDMLLMSRDGALEAIKATCKESPLFPNKNFIWGKTAEPWLTDKDTYVLSGIAQQRWTICNFTRDWFEVGGQVCLADDGFPQLKAMDLGDGTFQVVMLGQYLSPQHNTFTVKVGDTITLEQFALEIMRYVLAGNEVFTRYPTCDPGFRLKTEALRALHGRFEAAVENGATGLNMLREQEG